MRTAIAFYATPIEQHELMNAHLTDPDAWLLRWKPGSTETPELLAPSKMSEGQIQQDVHFHLGRHAISSPKVGIPADSRARPDLIRSGAVQLRAGAVQGGYLYESFLGMMQVGDYESAGVPGERVSEIFRKLRRFITSKADRSHQVMRRSHSGTLVPVRGVIVTSGATALVNNGIKLRQMPISRVELVLTQK